MNYTGHKTLAMVMRYTHPDNKAADLQLLEVKPEIQKSKAELQA